MIVIKDREYYTKKLRRQARRCHGLRGRELLDAMQLFVNTVFEAKRNPSLQMIDHQDFVTFVDLAHTIMYATRFKKWTKKSEQNLQYLLKYTGNEDLAKLD